MKIKLSSQIIVTLVLSSCLAGAATNLLTNPSFESPVAGAFGNNIGTAATGWTLVPTSTGTNNVVKPDASYTGGPKTAQDGFQYYDITGDSGYIYQNFTLASADTVVIGAYFSARETTAGSGSVSIWDMTNLGGTEVLNSGTVTPAASGYPWVLASSGVVSLMAGVPYQFRASLTDFTNVDSAYMYSTVPEPTTALAGILLGAGLLRRRRSVRVQA